MLFEMSQVLLYLSFDALLSVSDLRKPLTPHMGGVWPLQA